MAPPATSPKPTEASVSKSSADAPDVPSSTEPTSQSNAADDAPSAVAETSSASSPVKSIGSRESGEASPVGNIGNADAPPLPDEQPPTEPVDDGWDFHWDTTQQRYYFHNRFTNEWTWNNPRLPNADTAATTSASGTAEPPKNERPPAGGYNPAIHGDYDPNAWYAKNEEEEASSQTQPVGSAAAYAAIGSFNRFTGRWQAGDQNPEQHSDESKSRRQMNAFFDVDAAANAHDGRSLKAERSGKKPSKAELKQFKEKRRAKKEEKRRAWLRD